MERALFHMENSYSVANVLGRGFMCRTNLPSNTAFRGFGGPQGMMVAESWITDVAQTLNRPAHEVCGQVGITTISCLDSVRQYVHPPAGAKN